MFTFHLAIKDFRQFLRNRMTFLFLLIMPIVFTLMFGFAFRGTDQGSRDARLPVGFLNQDGSALSLELERLLTSSEVIRLESAPQKSAAELERAVVKADLAAAIVIPPGYGDAALTSSPLKLMIFADTADTAGSTALGEIRLAAGRLMSAVQAARLTVKGDPERFASLLKEALAAWQNPPVRLNVAAASAIVEETTPTVNPMGSFAHASPGMMLQFAIAALSTCSQIIIYERKSRCLQRILTTAASRMQILLGHYLAMFTLVFVQFLILIVFGQIFLQLNYLGQPLATLLIAFTSSLCIAALGLLIGALAKEEEHAIIFSLLCMFLFAGLGGAWMPLEYTGEVFQAIGRFTPLAWGMDGFKNVLLRGWGVEAALLPAAALTGYAVAFFALAVWRFKFE